MKRRTFFLCVGIIMLVIAIVFVAYALSNPQASFDLPGYVVYAFYLTYLVVMVLMFILAIVFRH